VLDEGACVVVGLDVIDVVGTELLLTVVDFEVVVEGGGEV